MPAMRQRLLQYDISRGRIPRTGTILAHADLLKPAGLTGILLYIECVVENSVFPASGCGRTPVTRAWLAELQAGLKDRGLELVPLIQLLGHQEHLLARPEMAMHGESEANAYNFRIDSPATRETIKRWLAELLPLFDSPIVHAGCDEASTSGLGRSAGFIRERGFEAAMADYFNDFASFFRQHGKTMIIYADALIHYPALRDRLAPDIVICNWGYGTWTETYERENHNFSRHAFVTAGRRNWACGNAMAEYILPPFERLETNTSIWLDLGGGSDAEGFIISDWGSFENINPFVSTVIGALYSLRRLSDPSYMRDVWLADVSRLVLGRLDAGFVEALRLIVMAQTNPAYFGDRLRDWGPILPALFLGQPDSRSVYRLCALFENSGLDAFERDARLALALMSGVSSAGSACPEFLADLQALARRFLVIALRTRLCHANTWFTGAFWLTKEDFEKPQRLVEEYRALATADLAWTLATWDRDNLESCREACRQTLQAAIDTASDTVKIIDNSLYRFPPAV